jgi:TRAP-type C4-dicarboxylate transport system permease small subunit
MWLSRAADSLNRVIHPLSRVIHGVGIGALAAMMFLTFADVSLRYVFNRPIIGAFDLTELMMVILVSFGLADCAVVKGHVMVDLVVSRLQPRWQVIIDAITSLLGLGLFSLITWQCVVYVKRMFATNVGSGVLHIPLSPFVALVAFGFAVLCLVLLTDFLDFLSQAIKKWNHLP